jgi:hypothetical protein
MSPRGVCGKICWDGIHPKHASNEGGSTESSNEEYMANKAALIKFSALDVAVITVNYSIDEGGIWVEGTTFANELKQKTTGETLPDLFNEGAYSFVPFSKVDWIITPEKPKNETVRRD